MLELFVFSIPEALGITFLAYSLSGAKASWYKVVIIGVVVGINSALVRQVLPTYFYNALIYMLFMIILFRVVRITRVWEATICVGFALPIYVLIEFLNISFLSSLGIDPRRFDEVFHLKVIGFAPQLTLTLLIALILRTNKVSLFFIEDKDV